MRASAGDGKPLRVQMQRVAVRVTQTERVTLGPGAPEQGLRDVSAPFCGAALNVTVLPSFASAYQL